jgi:hypothetical protein
MPVTSNRHLGSAGGDQQLAPASGLMLAELERRLPSDKVALTSPESMHSGVGFDTRVDFGRAEREIAYAKVREQFTGLRLNSPTPK